jgi:hypothetical protein
MGLPGGSVSATWGGGGKPLPDAVLLTTSGRDQTNKLSRLLLELPDVPVTLLVPVVVEVVDEVEVELVFAVCCAACAPW